jgi:hypothetical protein
MSSHFDIQNFGFTKTIINENDKKYNNELIWEGDYNGERANINVIMNDNGDIYDIKKQLTNNELSKLLGIPSVNIPLEERLRNDFLTPSKSIVLEGALTNNKKRKSSKSKKKRSKSYIGGRKNRKSIRRQ